MSFEQRENRPYKSIAQLEALVNGMTLYVGDRTVGAETTEVVSEDVFVHSPFVLRLASDETALREAVEAALVAMDASPYQAEDLAVVITASSSYLKIIEVLDVIPLRELAERPVSLSLTSAPRPKAMRSPRAGCEVEVAVCLSRGLEFRPLQAWRRWAWLSRSRFWVETEDSFAGFVPLPLDGPKRQEFELPAGTMRYIVIDSEFPVTDPSSSEESLQLYVDAELLALMSANDKSGTSRMLQRILFIDAVWAVVNQALLIDGLVDLGPDDIRGSLLDKVVRMATGPSATPAQLAAMLVVLRERPAKFMAAIEDRAEVLAGARDVIGGMQ